MVLSSFSSLIQLLGAFFFGFIGLRFLNKFYIKFKIRINNEKISITDQIRTFSQEEIKDIDIHLNQFENLKQKISLLYDQRFVELFVKGGIYSLLILFYIGIEGSYKTISSSFVFTSIFFISNTVLRIRFIFFKKPLIDIENIAASVDVSSNYFEIESIKLKQAIDFLFNGFKVHVNFKREIKNRMILFSIILVVLFHIPVLFHHFFIFIESFFEIPILNFYVTLLTLISLIFPYFLLFITDSVTFFSVYKIRKEITKKISQHNEAELLILIKS